MEIDRHTDISQPKWSWWELFIVIVVLISVLAFVAMFRKPLNQGIVSLGLNREQSKTLLLFVTSLIQSSAIIGSVIVITKRKGANLKELGIGDSKFLRNFGTGLWGGFLLGAVIWITGIVITLITGPPPPQEVEKMLSEAYSWKDVVFPFLAISILAPLSEELYFRGMVYPVFKARFGAGLGMLLSGMFFGFMHLDLIRFVPLSLGGFVLAYLYEKTKTLTAPIVAHFTWNTLMLVSFYTLAGS